MNFKYETQGTNTYIVYEIGDAEMLDSMTLGMITNNKISGLAQAFFYQQNSNKYVKYNISAKVSAEQFLMGTVNKKRLIGVFKGIVNAMISAEEYMIDANSICLDLDYIYTDVSTCETVVLCIPVTDETKPPVDLKAFFKNIVFSVQFDQAESGDYIAKLINYLNRVSAFSLYEFKDLLDSIENGERAAEQQASKPQPVVQQSVPSMAQPQVNTQPVAPQPQVVPQQPVAPVQRPTSVAQPVMQPEKPVAENNLGFAIPGQNQNSVAAPKKAENNQPAAQTGDEKEISWFYLMQHYNKENAALYKAQQEAKKTAKASGKPEKGDKKKEKKNNKAVPVATPNAGFAIPGQAPAPAARLSADYSAPVQRPTPVPQQPVQPQVQSVQVSVPQQAPMQQAAPVSQLYQAPMQPAAMPQQTGMTANFGDTTVLSSAGIGETTVLGASPMAMENTPHLIRTKNNERIMVNKPIFRIGKEKSFVDYFIGDNTAISRSHANIITRDGEYFVQDTNSTNHTYVDGQMIQSNIEVKIAHGTKIKLANEDFEFKLY